MSIKILERSPEHKKHGPAAQRHDLIVDVDE